jgi:hypothetical protein
MSFKKMRNKETYHVRRKRVYDRLLEYGISIGLAKRTVYRYPLNVLEQLIEKTEDRQPDDPANYVLNGLKRSRIRYGDSRKRDRKRRYWPVEENEKTLF